MIIGLSLSPTWLRGRAWREPASGVERMYELGEQLAIAQAAEAVGIDFLLKPDALHLDPSVLSEWAGLATMDPFIVMSAIAAHTERIGLVPTASTTFMPPFVAARQAQSLALLSHGRAGLNLVTSMAGNENFGLAELPDLADRYRQAEEFVDVVQALWRSFPSSAIKADPEGVYAEAALVQPINHRGAHFRVAGPLDVPGGQRIPIFQAGGSPEGVAFAGAKADAVFGMAAALADAQRANVALSEAARTAGRSPNRVRFLPGCALVLGESESAAQQRASEMGPGAAHWRIVGTPSSAAAEIRRWSDEQAIDGFIALPSGGRASLDLFLNDLMPQLRPEPPANANTLAARLGIGEGVSAAG